MALHDSPNPTATGEFPQEKPAGSREPSASLQGGAISPEPKAQTVPQTDNGASKPIDRTARFLSAVGTAVGLGGAVSLLLSVIYDWGFFRALDVDLPTLPSNLSDHVRAAVNWLPSTVVFVAIGALNLIMPIRLARGQSEEEIISRSRTPQTARFLYDSWKIMVWVPAIGGPLFYILFGSRFFWFLAFAAPLLWLFFAHWLIREPPLSRLERLPLFVTIAWLPAAALYIFAMGSLSGHSMRTSPSDHQIFIISHPTPITATILRSIDKGVLVLSADKKEIQFLPWASVTAIKMPTKPEFQGWLLDWL